MIIGQPKSLQEFQPLSAKEFAELRAQLEPAVANGAPLESPVALDLGTVCRLAATIGHFANALAAATANVTANVPAGAAPSENDPTHSSGESASAGLADLPPLPVLRPSV